MVPAAEITIKSFTDLNRRQAPQNLPPPNIFEKTIISLSIFMVGVSGFEPPTFRPPDGCAAKLRYTPNFSNIWSEWRDSNSRPPRPERGALPDCATFRNQPDKFLVGVSGFEPPTPWSQTRCAARLRHTPILCFRKAPTECPETLFSTDTRNTMPNRAIFQSPTQQSCNAHGRYVFSPTD